MQIVGGEFGALHAQFQFKTGHRPVVHQWGLAQVHECPQPERHDGHQADHTQEARAGESRPLSCRCRAAVQQQRDDEADDRSDQSSPEHGVAERSLAIRGVRHLQDDERDERSRDKPGYRAASAQSSPTKTRMVCDQ